MDYFDNEMRVRARRGTAGPALAIVTGWGQGEIEGFAVGAGR